MQVVNKTLWKCQFSVAFAVGESAKHVMFIPEHIYILRPLCMSFPLFRQNSPSSSGGENIPLA